MLLFKRYSYRTDTRLMLPQPKIFATTRIAQYEASQSNRFYIKFSLLHRLYCARSLPTNSLWAMAKLHTV